MAKHCAWTIGEDSRHPPSLPAQSLVADGVNTAMNAVQAFGVDAPSSAAFVDSDTIELGEGDHAVLVGSKTRDECIRGAVVTFPTHVGR